MPAARHKDYDLRYDEASEQWTCAQLGLENSSLKALRAAIDRIDKKARTMAVPALYLKEDYWNDKVQIVDCFITLIRADRRQPAANIKFKKSGKETEEAVLQNLYPPSAREKIEAYVAAKRREAAAKAEAEKILKETESFTPANLREAIVQQADEAA
jgi:hypothetical protein